MGFTSVSSSVVSLSKEFSSSSIVSSSESLLLVSIDSAFKTIGLLSFLISSGESRECKEVLAGKFLNERFFIVSSLCSFDELENMELKAPKDCDRIRFRKYPWEESSGCCRSFLNC